MTQVTETAQDLPGLSGRRRRWWQAAESLWRRISRMLARSRHRKTLRVLSNRQLRDAGIDYGEAGRGKSAAVHPHPRIHVGF